MVSPYIFSSKSDDLFSVIILNDETLVVVTTLPLCSPPSN